MAGDDVPPPRPTASVPRDISKARRLLEGFALDIELSNEAGAAVSDNSESSELAEFTGMMDSIEQTYNKYLELYDNTIDLAATLNFVFPEQQDQERLREVKSMYFQAKGHKVRLSRSSVPNNLNTSTLEAWMHLPAVHNSSRRTLLPKIQIKTFSGDFSEWHSFQQLFTALVIDDRTLSDSERFFHLTSFLDGIALDAIKHIKVEGNNFVQAWEALKRVFDDQRRLANTYLENLLNFKSPAGRPTGDSLQKFLSHVSESVTSLKNLDIPNLSEYLLCELALKALDPITREAFELQWVQVGAVFPDFDSLKQFVENRVHVAQLTKASSSKLDSAKMPKPTSKPPNRYSSKVGQSLLAHNPAKGTKRNENNNSVKQQYNVKFECFVCKGRHKIAECQEFQKLDAVGRLDALKSYPGCRNCFHPNHKSSSCTSEMNCKYYDKKHHSSLHIFHPSDSSSSKSSQNHSSSSSNQTATGSSNNNCCLSSTSNSSGVLLGTLVCRVRDSEGHYHKLRGVLDPGSQFSFIKAKACNDLKLSSKPHKGAISGVNQSNLPNIQGKVTFHVQSPSGYHNLETEAVVVPSITPPLPQERLDSDMWMDYKSYDLSDPHFTEPGPIDFLIGADLCPELITGSPIVIHANGPRLIHTIFGFTVIGRYSAESLSASNHISLLAHANPMFHLEKFWETEEPTVKLKASPEDEKCETHFKETHYRTPEGRYVVSLPFISPEPHVEPNIAGALNRLYTLESKFAKNPDLKTEYIKFMREYEQLGHMRVATTPPKFVIPHHPVFRVNGDEKKLRVVFDGSFRSKTGSLNDKLHIGPKLQADVSNILLNMRRFRYAITCDIVKMFRQISLRPEDRCYQQIAWRYSPNDPVVFYELNTVTYGTRSAPWLSMRAVRALVEDEGSCYPNASRSLMDCIYVDDVIDGRDTVEELVQLKTELKELLAKGGFSLSKWASNYDPILNEDLSDNSVSLCKDENLTTKILGMHWNPRTDAFLYVISPVTEGNSKRIILSTIARLFDPLGYLTPIIFHAKCIMQETWKHNLNWDEEVPTYIAKQWKTFTDELPSISQISINRALPKTDTSYQLLCFSDASERGYCATAYLRSTQGSEVNLTLLKAKSRLAPLKTETTPRLELCGALLLSELLDSLKPLRENLNITNVFCFTDSSIVLAWLRTPPHMLQIYVSRRVQKILESTKIEWWHHVKGCDNPADVGSRGSTPAALESHPLWWTGPTWCHEPIENWPLSGDIQLTDIPELKPVKLSLISIERSPEFRKYVERHSSWLRLVRVISWLKRFSANTKIPKDLKVTRMKGPLSAREIRDANFHIIRILQHAYYPEIFTTPFNNLPLDLRRLDVFIDSHGVIRVGGRLTNAPIPEDHKHPILLPARCHFTTILVRHFHKENNHVGPSTLLAVLRQQYWIPNAKNLVKKLTHECVTCTRYSRKRVVPFMGNLPRSRFAAVRPFAVCGVDFAGYFMCKESPRKNARTFKCYLSIFVCMSTRAYHLELVTSLTVEAFLDAFTRFTSRRGMPAQMMSDLGTNFVGTVNYLKTVNEWLLKEETQSAIIDGTSHLGVNWHFNPPAAPHFGGSWETGVKAVKNLIYKTFNHLTYTQEELTTIFVKIEGILNSRPLQPLSTSSSDPEALTPAHFLVGQPLTAPPELDFSDVPANRLSRWQLIQERIQHFWRRWSVEYVSSLQLREKWTKKIPNVKVGDVVLLTDLNLPPMRWPLALVLEIHPGEDETVRVVTLKTSKGIFKRPTVKLVPLPIES